MPKIGVLFDIDELEAGMYGHAAYKIFFDAIDTRQLAGCLLSDGDTNATLRGRANQYCIAVESPDAAKIAVVKNALGKSTAKGLLPPSSRFLEDVLVRQEPLVLAARIDSTGELVDCQTSWVTTAWKDSREKHRRASAVAEAAAEDQPRPTVAEEHKPAVDEQSQPTVVEQRKPATEEQRKPTAVMEAPAASRPAASTPATAARLGERLIGKTLGQYQIVEEIGRGGMAVVYKAYQPSLTRHVAIKVLPPQLSFDQDFVERFMREARGAATLRHPNIITIYDVSEQEGLHYFVMEYIAGKTLDTLATETPLPLPRIAQIVQQVADALDYAHSQGVIHRDIKPSNILVDDHDRAVLTDFGLVRVGQDSKLTKTGTIIGTPEYMSPEQAQGEDVDWRTDIYSLGIVLYRVLTGTVPFVRSTPAAVLLAHVAYEPPAISQINRSVPPAVEAVVVKAMTKDRNRRYQSARQLASDLQVAVTGQMPAGLEAPAPRPVAAPAPAPTTPLPGAAPVAPRKARAPLLISAGLGVAVVSVLCVVAAVLIAPKLLSMGIPQMPQVSPSPVLLNTATPPPAALSLKNPADGAVFAPGDAITLAWEAIPGLAEGDLYAVTLDCDRRESSASAPQTIQVKETSYTIPASLYPSLKEPYQCRWSVKVVDKTGAARNAPSDTRQFSWSQPVATRPPTVTPTATATPTPAATATTMPTHTPTATRLLPTSTARPRPTNTPVACIGNQVWDGTACVCPPDTIWVPDSKWCVEKGQPGPEPRPTH